jgi:hypothetical protein
MLIKPKPKGEVMRNLPKILFTCLAVGTLFCHALWAQAAAPAQAPLAMNELAIKDMNLKWKADSAKGLLHVVLSAPTTGWVAIGFNPSRAMKDANFVIGYVKESKAFAEDDFGTGWFSHESDVSLGGKDDITGISGSEINGATELRFAIPLNSGDKFDQALSAGKSYNIILAYGAKDADNFTGKHKKAYKQTIKL